MEVSNYVIYGIPSTTKTQTHQNQYLMFYRETTTLARQLFLLVRFSSPFHLLNFSVLVEQNNSEWSVSLVRPDGASRRVRWQHWKIQAPRMFFFGASDAGRHSFGYFSFAVERKVTRPRCENRNAKQKHLFKS